MGMPPSHIYYGSDPGDRDDRFSGSGGGSGGGWIALGITIFLVAFIIGLILMAMYLPFWVGYVVLAVFFSALAFLLITVFRKGSEER